jgi:hypothetical protein
MPRKPHTHYLACLTDFYGKVVCRVLGETISTTTTIRPVSKTSVSALPMDFDAFRKLVIERHGNDRYTKLLWDRMQNNLHRDARTAMETGTFDKSWIPSDTWCALTFDLPDALKQHEKAVKLYSRF